MTTPTDTALPRVDFVIPAVGELAAFGKPTFSKGTRQTASGSTVPVHQYGGVPVFRSGTFADSMGREREWEPTQMSQMVANFDKLRADGNFKDVPVRKGHPGVFTDNMDGLIGYITALRTEVLKSPLAHGESYTYLLADFDIIDEDAQKKIDSGLWRNRSAEIGMYPTNSPVTEHYPVFMGVAYVDIPAVEGLEFAKACQSENARYTIQTEVSPMTGSNPATPTPSLPPQLASFTINGTPTTDHAAVSAHITRLEAENTAYSARIATLATEVDGYKAREREAAVAARGEFVKALATADKLGANEIDSETAFAVSLSDEQFAQYKSRWERQTANPMFGAHGHTGTDDGRPATGGDTSPEAKKATQIAELSGVVKGLRDHSKMSPEAVMQTAAFSQLIALDPTVTLAGLK